MQKKKKNLILLFVWDLLKDNFTILVGEFEDHKGKSGIGFETDPHLIFFHKVKGTRAYQLIFSNELKTK